jgi:chloride channel protein, CIC family
MALARNRRRLEQETARVSIPSTLYDRGASRFWVAVILTGIGAGIGGAALTTLLDQVQHLFWPPAGESLLDAAKASPGWYRIVILAGAGILTGLGQLLLVRLSSGNGIEITTALWFHAGRLPALRTVGSAILSVVIVGMGASLGREGAPKQFGAVTANVLSDRFDLSDEQRRLLVACGAGAGMAAAYNVPLGGALFALEVLRGVLALRLVLPAVTASLIATMISWIAIPDAATYNIPSFQYPTSILYWALIAGPIAGVVSVGYVRAVEEADRLRPKGSWRLVAPVIVFGLLGATSIWLPQLLGNGKDATQLAFTGQVGPILILLLLALKPLATVLCLGSGAPGGLFTPSLTLGALLGGALGYVWTLIWPGAPLGLFAVIGAGAVLAATTQGPISAAVLMIELTGHDRAFLLPMLIAIVTATLVARTIDSRSIYDARLTDEELVERQAARQPSAL